MPCFTAMDALIVVQASATTSTRTVIEGAAQQCVQLGDHKPCNKRRHHGCDEEMSGGGELVCLHQQPT